MENKRLGFPCMHDTWRPLGHDQLQLAWHCSPGKALQDHAIGFTQIALTCTALNDRSILQKQVLATTNPWPCHLTCAHNAFRGHPLAMRSTHR